MTDWFVYQADGNHIGPVTTDALARGIIAGKVPQDAHVAARGGAQWFPFASVPEIQQALAGLQGQNVGPRPMNSVPPAPPPAKDSPTIRDLMDAAPAAPAAAAPAPEKKAEEKKDAPKPPPLPAYAKMLPLMIFGAFFVIALIEVGVSFAIAPAAPAPSGASGATSAAKK